MKKLALWFCCVFLMSTTLYASIQHDKLTQQKNAFLLAMALDNQIMTEYRDSQAINRAIALDNIIEEGSYISPSEVRSMNVRELYVYEPELVNRKLLAMKTKDRRETIKEVIVEIAKENNLSPTLALSIAKAESHFNPMAVSHKGAKGVMQLMDATAADHGVEDSHNTIDNIRGGIIYLKKLLEKYDGNITLAVAAYNAGPGNVDRYGGVPPFKETQQYVKKVLAFFREYKEGGKC